MNIIRFGLVFLYYLGFLKLSDCTSWDETPISAVTAGKLHTANSHAEKDQINILYSYEDETSVEYKDDYPRVAFSTKPKDSARTAIKGQGQGRDRKKNPCLRKRYRNYCVHGVCQYLSEINRTSCICDAGYSGDRCHLFILSVGREDESNSHTTALAVMAVVLSLLCLTIIGVLMVLRCHKKGDSCVDEKIRLKALQDNEEKAKVTTQRFSRHDGYHLETSCQC